MIFWGWKCILVRYKTGVKVRPIVQKLHAIFVLGLYGALYTQNQENSAICLLNSSTQKPSHASLMLL